MLGEVIKRILVTLKDLLQQVLRHIKYSALTNNLFLMWLVEKCSVKNSLNVFHPNNRDMTNL